MSINIVGILDEIVSHALSLGVLESVNTHEPKSAPGPGVTAAIWVQRIEPIRSSGLASSSVRLEFRERLYTNMIQEPQDAIDPEIVAAADALCEAYSGDFTLDGQVRMVDLLGAYGAGLSVVAGYLNQDGRLYRAMDIAVPLILNDSWAQVE